MYADIAVNSPAAQRNTFCYSVPSEFDLKVGQAVLVPFGKNRLQGIVIRLSHTPSYEAEAVRPIDTPLSDSPVITPTHIELSLWMSRYYLAPLWECLSLCLPPGFGGKVNVFVELRGSRCDISSLSESEAELVEWLRGRGKVNVRDIQKQFGRTRSSRLLQKLLDMHVVSRSEEPAPARVKPKLEKVISLLESNAEFLENCRKMLYRSEKQLKLVDALANAGGTLTLDQLKSNYGDVRSSVRLLEAKGIIKIMEKPVRRDPLVDYDIIPAGAPGLTPVQERAWQEVLSFINGESENRVCLLHGVTGSGKTELYLWAFEEILRRGKKGIFLVPEISLTPQVIQRFAARFGKRLAIYHSGLSQGEQYDEWHRIARGECDIVIGARSALFTPQVNPGLIIIDEEHEWTYKQSEDVPRYHTRLVAERLAELTGARVMLGSATPDVESYFLASHGRYRLVMLPERYSSSGAKVMPSVDIVDMREEVRYGHDVFSRLLLERLRGVLERKEQAIMFLNRRGTASFARCFSCGFTVRCPRCLVALTYHMPEGRLMCHHCNYRMYLPRICPECGRQAINLYGIGTKRVEDELRKRFPEARIFRWDSDLKNGRNVYTSVMERLVRREIDILVGTQMIAKGLDLPAVTLACVIHADSGINYPDFRAAERTFQLTCQIAGRAGRGDSPGVVVVQTYNPAHYAILAAARHDYNMFYEKELAYRKALGYPPFNQMALMLFSHTNEEMCHRKANEMLRLLQNEKLKRGITNLRFIGPVPAVVPRLRGKFRQQIVLCGRDLSDFLSAIPLPEGWILDIDPVGVF